MVVTKIELLTKTKYKIDIDGQFAFVLYKGELSRYGIAEDQEIAEETIGKIETEVLIEKGKIAGFTFTGRYGQDRRRTL